MEGTAITVRVPATSANIGTGFDCLGLALDLFASITVTFSEAEQVSTNDVGEKMVLSAARAAYERIGLNRPRGLSAQYTVAIPLGRGLGASAVARVAGILAVNEREGHPLDTNACLALAADLEGHADNACPALFGGVQACVGTSDGFAHVRCGYPEDLQIVLLIPDHSMPTKEARRLLPDSYSRQDAIHTSSRLGLLVASLAAGRIDLLDEATQDRFHQHQRSALFPPLFDVFDAAKAAGAHAAWLSGAGSSVAAFVSEQASRDVGKAMLDVLEGAGMSGRSLVTRIAPSGAEVSRVEVVDI
ncbi:MAG TPA: homoserine kinase [Dehalococcoidia bacterium]|nr:homoserine kinase [Dehalococcoidia bacterium]|tara:strand:- start:1605 stop:2510 length:906 start_codon:yes stop_codon:yes gene_type:complete